MDILVVLALLAAIGVAAAVVLRRRAAAQHRPLPASPTAEARAAETFDTSTLAVGTRLTMLGRPGRVVAAVHYRDEEDHWSSFLVSANGRERWLTVVQELTGPETVAWEVVPMPPGTPGDDEIEYGGTTYLLQDRGFARYRSEGRVDLRHEGTMEYVDYLVGKHRLSLERYDGGEWQANVGEVVPVGDILVGR